MSLATRSQIVDYAYIVAVICFIYSLKWMNKPVTAQKGNRVGEIGMAIAILATLLNYSHGGVGHVPGTIADYQWIVLGLVLGAVAGIPLAVLTPMKDVPQQIAFMRACGGLAAALVGTAEFYLQESGLIHSHFNMAALCAEVILGYLTFTGSLVAAGKLQEILPQKPILYKGHNVVKGIVLIAAVGVAVYLNFEPTHTGVFIALIAIPLLLGVLLIMAIGGADMPTVIALLNAYGGLSSAMMGFVLANKLLIVAGALDGSSGLILSIIMCKAMNRSFTNVLFGGFGAVASKGTTEKRPYRSGTAEEAASILEAASSVVIVPGYGMAVAQAQHKVRELYDALTKAGIDVKFAIHPVAGRMPGHMNVILADANVPYDALVEMDDINPEFAQTDVVLIIGANDVTNPAAKTDKTSPIYGMPILDVDKARSVMVIKRSMSPGFAGIDNDLFYMDKTLMLFGDAKGFTGDIVKEFSAAMAGA
ncbi:MAG TPA: NAD(P)(+) transhydrogenase (Re/Si-specific) subunit beta [Actinomycetota bacterium]|nr:NAD(P)(+) transhydrogenase (Re/Si-specific) subunit beta [Actinomycetota bacterium]